MTNSIHSGNQAIRASIVGRLDHCEITERHVANALALSFHPWPDGHFDSVFVESIRTELCPEHNLNHVSTIEIAIDRLLRFAVAAELGSWNVHATAYREAANVLDDFAASFASAKELNRRLENLPVRLPWGQTSIQSPKQFRKAIADQTLLEDIKFPSVSIATLFGELLNAAATANCRDIEKIFNGKASTTTALTLDQLADELQIDLPARMFDRYLERLSGRDRAILLQRLYADEESATLQDLGIRLGITRERIRQIEQKVNEDICYRIGSPLQCFARASLNPLKSKIVSKATVSRRLHSITFGSRYPTCLMSLLLEQFGPWRTEGDWLFHANIEPQVRQLESKIAAGADHLLSIEPEIIDNACQNLFLSESERNLYLETQLGLGRFINQWTFKQTLRCRVVAALKFIGEPATAAEISDLIGHSRTSTSSTLGNLPGMVWADRFRWGFADWVPEPYGGICAEIEKRIEEGNGVALVDAILNELPTKFNVLESSVKAFLNSDEFSIEGNEVRFANDNRYEPRPPEDHPNAIFYEGRWGHRQMLAERHFRGFSLGVSFDIAYANGIRPSDDLVVPAEGATGHLNEVSVIWRPRSLSRLVDVGRVSAVLSLMNFKPGDEILIFPSRASVIFRSDTLRTET